MTRRSATPIYAHKQPYARASERPTSAPLTHNERLIKAAFLGVYQQLADAFRSDEFKANFDPQSDGARVLVQHYLASANRRALDAFNRILIPVANVGVMAGERQVSGWLRRFTKAGPSAAQSPVLTELLERMPGGSLSPMYPGSYPPQVPPRRRLLRIPRPQLGGRIQPATGGRDAFTGAPQVHLDAINELSLNLVTMISETQREGILAALDEGIRQGYDGEVIAMMIANLVGLFPRWQQAVENRQQIMLDQGRPMREVEYRTRRYSDWLRERRGIMIARTEIMTALNTGRIKGWHQQADMGFLDPALSEKEWLSAPGACPLCAAMNGTRVVGLDSEFDTDAVAAEAGIKGFGRVKAPPCHPHDRCTVLVHPIRSADQFLSDEPRGGLTTQV